MSDQPPKEPSGSSPIEVWGREMVRYVRRITLRSAPNGKVNSTTEGTFIVPDGGSGGTTTSGPVRATLSLVMGDHLLCNLSDGTPVKVAKNPKLRLSLHSETIEGVVYTYTSAVYTTAGIYYRRDATPDAGVLEKQTVNPDYLALEEIWIDPITPFETLDPIPVTVTYIEHFARLWLRRLDQGS